MPELPEVETIKRQLERRLPGRRVVAACSHPSPEFSQADRIVGTVIGTIGRRGKYLIVPCDGDRELIIHLGMTGTLTFLDPTPPRTDQEGSRWPRARWTLDDGSMLELGDQRRFGRVAVVAAGDYSSLPTLASIGPEPLDPTFTARQFHRGITRGHRRIKTRLLDQRAVAGIGNIYADEALWRARINPVARRIGAERAASLHRALVGVLTAAIEHGGTRLRDYRSIEGDTGAHQWHLDCYGRHGMPCSRCGVVLRRRIVDGRGTTSCPVCQAR